MKKCYVNIWKGLDNNTLLNLFYSESNFLAHNLLRNETQLFNYIRKSENGYTPYICFGFENSVQQLHCTAFFNWLNPTSLNIAMKAWDVFIRVATNGIHKKELIHLGPKLAICSEYNKDAVIYGALVPKYRKWNRFHMSYFSYKWIPHITFENNEHYERYIHGFVPMIPKIWVGYLPIIEPYSLNFETIFEKNNKELFM